MSKSDESVKYPTEAEIDETLKESFPASDPPSWTRGIEQPERPQAKSNQAKSDQPEGEQQEGDSDTASAGRAS